MGEKNLKNNSDSCPDSDVISMDHPGYRSYHVIRYPHAVVPRVLVNTDLVRHPHTVT